jgi:hypothetical protein
MLLNHKPTLMNLLVANPKQQTQVVVIDSAFVLFQSFAGRDVGLEEYAGRTYLATLDSTTRFLLENSSKVLGARQITSFADVEIASAISRDDGTIYPIRGSAIRADRCTSQQFRLWPYGFNRRYVHGEHRRRLP